MGAFCSKKCGWVEAFKFFIVGGGSDTEKFKMVGGGPIYKNEMVGGGSATKFKMVGGPPRRKSCPPTHTHTHTHTHSNCWNSP